MKKYLSIFSFILCLAVVSNAQAPQQNMDESMDKTIEQLESFLDTFALGQMFNSQMMGNMLSEEEMQIIQDQMKLGLSQLKGFDFSQFEGMMQQLQQSLPQMDQFAPMMPPSDKKIPNTQKQDTKEQKPVKKI